MQGVKGLAPPDPSLLQPGLTTTITGLRQAISALHTATQEVKRYMLDEASIIYECKTCHNMFRSLANLIAHKRSYCCHQYQKVQHVFTEKVGQDFAASQTVFIESEPLETVVPEDAWDTVNFSPSLYAIQEKAIAKRIQEMPVVNRLLPPRKEGLQSVIARLGQRLEPAADNTAILIEPLTQNKNAVFQNLLDIRTIGEDFGGRKGSAKASVVVGPDGNELLQGLPQDSDTMRPCSPSGSDNSKENDASEPRSRTRYPCPVCKKEFSNVSTVYSHLSRKHGKSDMEARKMRKRIKAGARVVMCSKKNSKALKEKPFDGAKGPAVALGDDQPPQPAADRPQQKPVYEVKKFVSSDAPLRFAMQIGLVSRGGVGMQKVNRLSEAWETKDKDDQTKKIKSRLERRLARKKEGIEMEGNTDDDDEDTEISFNLERLSPQAPAAKKIKLETSSYQHGDYECQFCKKTFKTNTFLNQHYTTSHFRMEIMADFPEDMKKKKCSICAAAFENHARLAVHLGATHRMVLRYLSQGQPLPTQPPPRKLGRPPSAQAACRPEEPDSPVKISSLSENPSIIEDEFI